MRRRALLKGSVARLVIEEADCDAPTVVHRTGEKSKSPFSLAHHIEQISRHGCLFAKLLLHFGQRFKQNVHRPVDGKLPAMSNKKIIQACRAVEFLAMRVSLRFVFAEKIIPEDLC